MRTVPADAPAWNAHGLRLDPCGGHEGAVRAQDALDAVRHRDAAVREAAAHVVPAPTAAGARHVASIRARATRWSARYGGGTRPTTEECWREDRHHLLSDVRRLRRGRDRARHRARGARARSPLHHVPAAVPSARHSRQASTSTKWTSVRYPLFEYPPYDLALAVRMHEVVRDHELELLHATTRFRTRRARGSRARCSSDSGSSVQIITTLHGTDITHRRPGSVVPHDHEVLDRAVGWAHGRLRVPAPRDDLHVRLQSVQGRGDPQLHRSGASTAASRYPQVLRQQAGEGKRDHPARLELPPDQARARCRADLRAGSSGSCRACSFMVGDGPDRAEAEEEARRARRRQVRVLPREARLRRAVARERRALSAARA